MRQRIFNPGPMDKPSVRAGSRTTVRHYLDVAAGIIVEIDRQDRVVLINRHGCSLLGYPEAEITGADWFATFVPSDQRDEAVRLHRRLLEKADGTPEQAEYDVLASSGARRCMVWHSAPLVDERGRCLGVLYAGEDITGRRQVEQALRDSEARARVILETTLDAIITVDERGVIESFNKAAETIFGYTAEEAIGQNIKVLMPSPYREAHDGYLQAYHTTREHKMLGIGREVVAQRKDGTVFPIDLIVSEVPLGDRWIFSGIIRDLSERRRLEREVLEVSAEVQQQIGQELHDGLGSHLTGVAMACRALARRLEKGLPLRKEDIEEIADLVQEGAQQARLLARGLNPVRISDQGLQTALQELASNIERLAGIPCLFQAADAIPPQDAETKLHLYRIAQEAVNNALKHAKAEHLWIRLAFRQHAIVLTVQDDGVGLPASLEESGGIGRRVMQHRAHLIGATLRLQDAPGGGTLVSCTLPLDENNRPAMAAPSQPAGL